MISLTILLEANFKLEKVQTWATQNFSRHTASYIERGIRKSNPAPLHVGEKALRVG